MARLILFLVALTLIVPCPASSAAGHAKQTERANRHPKNVDEASAPRSVATPQFSTNKPAYAIENYTYNAYNYSQHADLWTIIVGIATAVIAGFTVALWWTTRKQWWVSREALKAAESPLMVARVKAPIHDLAVGRQPWVEVHLINIGKTPARRSTYKTWADILGYPLSEFGPQSSFFESPMESTIYPGAEVIHAVSIRHLRTVTTREHDDLSTARSRFYFRIRVDYYDRFGDSHFTDSCWGATDDTAIEPAHKYNDFK